LLLDTPYRQGGVLNLGVDWPLSSIPLTPANCSAESRPAIWGAPLTLVITNPSNIAEFHYEAKRAQTGIHEAVSVLSARGQAVGHPTTTCTTGHCRGALECDRATHVCTETQPAYHYIYSGVRAAPRRAAQTPSSEDEFLLIVVSCPPY
jgi:hypothetical protein